MVDNMMIVLYYIKRFTADERKLMSSTLLTDACTDIWYGHPRLLSDYARADDNDISEALAEKLEALGWLTDFNVILNPAVFGELTDPEKEALRSALGIEERRLKLVGNYLRW